ncbi:hypothetical protein N0029_004961 [Escherichia coli]|nr:hypothetical protein [Escherichia coli]
MFKSDLSDSQFEKLVALQKYLPSDDQPTRQAKHLLVEGFTPEFVAEYTGVKLEKVQKLYEESWNPRCRVPLSVYNEIDRDRNVFEDRRRKSLLMWNCGMNIEEIAKELKVTCFHVWGLLSEILPRKELNQRLPKPGSRAYREFIFIYRRHSNKVRKAMAQKA